MLYENMRMYDNNKITMELNIYTQCTIYFCTNESTQCWVFFLLPKIEIAYIHNQDYVPGFFDLVIFMF